MLLFYKKYWRTAFDIGLIALTVYLIMLTFSFLYNLATPIFLALFIFILTEPLSLLLTKLGLKKSVASGISITLFALLIAGIVVGLSVIIASQFADLTTKLPEYQKFLTEQFGKRVLELKTTFFGLPPEVTAQLQEGLDSISSWATNIAKSGLSSLGGYLTSLSTFIFNFVVGIILAYFLSIEIDQWKRLASEKTPKTFKTAYYFLKTNVFSGILVYIKAQLKLISITFLIIYISLLVLGVNNALAIASLSALFDILPLLGVATIFIPWVIYLFIVGQTTLAIQLLVLYLVVALLRQFLEPKITGDTIGVSAFTMLSAMIISLTLFGVAGLILAPILVILIKALYDQGYFHQWISAPKDEFDSPSDMKV